MHEEHTLKHTNTDTTHSHHEPPNEKQHHPEAKLHYSEPAEPEIVISNRTIVLILLVALVIVVGYIAYDKYTTAKEQEKQVVFQQGIQMGYSQAITQVVQQAQLCQPLNVAIPNVTVQIIGVHCLNMTKLATQTKTG